MSLFQEKNASCNSWLMGNSYCMSSSVLILFWVSEKIVAVNIESFSVKSWVLLWVLGECVFCHLHLVHCVPSSSSSAGSWAITEASLVWHRGGSVGAGLVARPPPGSGGAGRHDLGTAAGPWNSLLRTRFPSPLLGRQGWRGEMGTDLPSWTWGRRRQVWGPT